MPAEVYLLIRVHVMLICAPLKSKVPHKEEAHGGAGQAASSQPVPAHLANGAIEQEAGGNYEYDLVVLGGGSGGLAAAKVRFCSLSLSLSLLSHSHSLTHSLTLSLSLSLSALVSC